MSLLRAYYNEFSNNPAIFPFAAQLYHGSIHWFVLSGNEGKFIDDSYANAAEAVQTDPTYRTRSPSWLTSWFLPNTSTLVVLGEQHLREHIKPAYRKNLIGEIETGLKTGKSCVEAANQSVKKLRDQHETYLNTSVPYGIMQLKSLNVINNLPGYITGIQISARYARVKATQETLFDEYVNKSRLSQWEADWLIAESALFNP